MNKHSKAATSESNAYRAIQKNIDAANKRDNAAYAKKERETVARREAHASQNREHCNHSNRGWQLGNWTCVECGDVNRVESSIAQIWQDKAESLAAECDALRAQNATLLAACNSLVQVWKQHFEGQDTGYEDTPLHDCVKEAQSAIAAAEKEAQLDSLLDISRPDTLNEKDAQ